jgi:glycosyltransferase involved in cell wall biosynthesis
MNEIPLHLVNSNYSEAVIRQYYNGRLHAKMNVLYPPVDIQAWASRSIPNERKGVISVARFSPWKRHDMQLQIVGNDISLTMVGGARAPIEIQTVQTLKLMKPDNVRLFVNLPIQNLQRLLWTSKVFLHTADTEPFGLSIVEAMAAGCVPVIRRCGGADEVVPVRELTFTNASEAQGIVRRALIGDFDHYLPQLQEHIRKFDESVFSNKFLAAVNQAGHWHMQAETGESREDVR